MASNNPNHKDNLRPFPKGHKFGGRKPKFSTVLEKKYDVSKSDFQDMAQTLGTYNQKELTDVVNDKETPEVLRVFAKAYIEAGKKGDYRFIKDFVSLLSSEETTPTESLTTSPKDVFLSKMLNPKYTTNVFRNVWSFLFNSRYKILVSRGGTRSTKSNSDAHSTIALTYLFPNTRILVCRRTVKLLKKTVLRDTDEILNDHDLKSDFDFHKTDRLLTNKTTGSEIEFCAFATAEDAKGVKANFVFMDEAPEMSFNLFQELLLRLDKDAKFILSFNPVDEFSWVNEKVEQNPHRKDVQVLVSTYLDNPFLSESQVKEIELLRQTNEQLWKIYGLGEYGRVEGLVFPNWSKCSSTEFDQIAANKTSFGVDWGFNDPTTVVYAKFDSRFNTLYLKEIAYFTKDEKYIETATAEIKTSKYWTKQTPVLIDHKPEALIIMQQQGLNADNANKKAGSIKGGIDLMNSVKIVIEEDSYNLIREFHSYLYQEDRDGRVLDKPVDFMNHAIDASRYASMFIFDNYKIDFSL